jgi:hypothetical protein
MFWNSLTVVEERAWLALRFLQIGCLLMGTARRAPGSDAISPCQYELLRDEAEWIAQRLGAGDRMREAVCVQN